MDTAPNWQGTGFEAFLDYWDGLHEGGSIAKWRDFNAAEVAPLLGQINAVDVIDGGSDFRFRVYGTRFSDWLRLELTGKSVGEIEEPERAEKSMRLYRRAMASERPQAILYRIGRGNHRRNIPPGEDAWVLRVAVPFTSDGERVDRLLGYGDVVGPQACRQIFGDALPDDGAVFGG